MTILMIINGPIDIDKSNSIFHAIILSHLIINMIKYGYENE